MLESACLIFIYLFFFYNKAGASSGQVDAQSMFHQQQAQFYQQNATNLSSNQYNQMSHQHQQQQQQQQQQQTPGMGFSQAASMSNPYAKSPNLSLARPPSATIYQQGYK